MEKQFENLPNQIMGWVSNHKKLTGLALIALIVFFIGTSSGIIPLSTTNIVNPGVEGAKANCYGVIIQSGGTTASYNPSWTGLNTMHFIGDHEVPLATTGDPSHNGEAYYWGTGSGASQFTAQHFTYYDSWDFHVTKHLDLTTAVESNIQLHDFNWQTSTPLAIPGAGDPTQAEYIQYWQLSAVSTISSSKSTINSTAYMITTSNSTTYTLTKAAVILVPGDFHIDVFIVPSQDANTGSGWSEGSFSNLELWYMISWYDWLNSLGQQSTITNDPTPPTIPDGAINRNSLFNLRGGVPISAWIQNYYMPYITDNGQNADLLKVQVGTSGSTSTTTLYGQQLPSDVLANLVSMAKNGMSPSLNGHYIDLYTQPSDKFTYVNLQPDNMSAVALQNVTSPVPDTQTELPNEYFKIGVTGLGTDVLDHGLFANPRWTVYYPSVSYLIRVIMAVYGTHTYVWTVNTATQQGYNNVTTTTLPNGTQVQKITSGWTDNSVAVTTGGAGIPNVFGQIGSWFNGLSPWAWLGIGAWFWFIAVGVFVVCLLWFVGPPRNWGKKSSKK